MTVIAAVADRRRAPGVGTPEDGGVEERLVRRVLDALLREDFRGMLAGSRLSAPAAGLPDRGAWLALDLTGGGGGDGGDGGGLLLPVRSGGFLCDHAVRRGVLARPEGTGYELLGGLAAVLAALRPAGDPEAEAGFASFEAECREALDAELAAAAAQRDGGRPPLPDAPARPGFAASLAYDAAAARLGHPVYPTSAARRGLRSDDLRRYAPEHAAPAFDLRWVALPRERLALPEGLPAWWPSGRELGLPAALDATHALLPVHPLTWGRHLASALDGAQVAPAVPARQAAVRVTPTLSMRTVAVVGDEGTHLKLPLPTATLGALNRRTLRPGDLADGAAAARLIADVAAREPAYAGRILHAEESAYCHAGHDLLAVLIRRHPAGLTGRHIVPVAAFAAPDPAGRPLLAGFAALRGEHVTELFGAYLDLLLGWHVTLWLRYGIALEAHQQNVSLVVDPRRPGPGGLALLYRDDDGLRIDPTLAAGAPAFADPRIASAAPADLADVFTTITLHLCAAAPAFALAGAGCAPRAALLGCVRDRLEAALAAHPGARDARLVRERVLEAARLPVKAMLTAGTLLPKSRTGAADINKFYVRTGPNYLRRSGGAP